MYYETKYGTLKIKVKTGECLYGQVSLDGTSEVLESWIYFGSDGRTGDVEVRSNKYGLLGFGIDSVTGEAFELSNSINAQKLTQTGLYRAACQLFNHLESNASLKEAHFIEGILLAVMLRSPLIMKRGLKFNSGQLQGELFHSYCNDDAFEKCHLAPRASTYFEKWFFFEYFGADTSLWEPKTVGSMQGNEAKTKALTPAALRRNPDFHKNLAAS